jgi:hypothetical protein
MGKEQASVLEKLVAEVLRAGANALEVEYDDGYDEVCLMRGPFGWGIGRFRSSSPEAITLREELYRVARKKRRMNVDGRQCEVSCRVRDSFGEAAFRIEIRRT